jgi:hypothetical protein
MIYIFLVMLGIALGAFLDEAAALLGFFIFLVWILIPYLLFGILGLSIFAVIVLYAGYKRATSSK